MPLPAWIASASSVRSGPLRRRPLRTVLVAAGAAVALALGAQTVSAAAALSAPASAAVARTSLLPAGSDAADPAGAAGSAASTGRTHTVTYDHYSLMVDGKRLYLWSGEFHYWRLPSPSLWLDVLQKMKAAGFNATSIYFDWGYHSPKQGGYDFSGVRDVDRLLTMAAQVGIYVIARPGPYINAETDLGGFPGWLTTQQGRARSSAADFQAASDEWLDHIDPIIARHQLTTGKGTVILYQIENEYGNNTDAAYMAHTEQLVRSHGITVPFTHNHCCGASTWATGTGAVDIPGQDSYPQGFNCSNPSSWSGVGGLPAFRNDAPIFTAEFQGGSFDPWGGPGYAACRTLTGADFEQVFYTNNVASGATMQNLYMTYGGTSWGWLPDPSQVYTSYDYGAPISEQRDLDAKYAEAHRLGSFFAAAEPLTKTDGAATTPTDNAAVSEQLRVNPDNGTQFLVVRHKDSTSTATDRAHVSIDLGARGSYTYDDNDPALSYTGSWSHVGAEQNYTGADYQHTESFSNRSGDSMSVTFTGTSVRWISGYDQNHGISDVYLDGTKVATVDGYGASKVTQQVFYAADGLAAGQHTLKIVATGTKNSSATGTYTVVDAIDVPPAGSVRYATVPQQPGTAITLAGRDAKLLVANYALGAQKLVYSTSQLMTQARIGGQDVAVLYGKAGEDGETLLRYDAQPHVTLPADGSVTSSWDAARGDLRLNYKHGAQVMVGVDGTSGGQPAHLRLYLTTDTGAASWWQQQTSAGPVLVYGPKLVRTARIAEDRLELTGDTDAATPVTVLAPASVESVSWNGARLGGRSRHESAAGLRPGLATVTGTLPGPRPVNLPALTGWRYTTDTPEARPEFDDASWTVADRITTNNPTKPGSLPVLYADDYGFHHGDVWYRGHFTSTGQETGVALSAITGKAGVYAVWLNGSYLGSSGSGAKVFPIPAHTLVAGQNAVISVLVENMGHNEDFSANDSHKEPRGLTLARLVGAHPTLTWRIQGNAGGENLVDPVRGVMNASGLYGERHGYALPGYPDRSWTPVSLPRADATPGVGWYRTTFRLDLPRSQDTSIGLQLTDDPSRHYRAQIFVNGWLIGRYVNDVGPQHVFAIPNGILHANGVNTVAIASWGTGTSAGAGSGPGLGSVQLTSYFTDLGGVRVQDVNSPGYRADVYRDVPAPARLTLAGPDALLPGGQGTVSATLTLPATAGGARNVAITLAAPAGWQVVPASSRPIPVVPRGGSVTVRFAVTAPSSGMAPYTVLTATATARIEGRQVRVTGARAIQLASTSSTTPVGHWAFDEGSGTTAADSSGRGNTATLVGSGAGWAAGKVGSGSLALNGNSAYAQIAKPVVDTSKNFTVAAWVKLNSTSGYQTAVSIDGSAVSGFYLQLRGDTGAFGFTRLTGDSTSETTVVAQATTALAQTGTWYHLVGVQDADHDRIQFYLNGVLQDDEPYTASWTASGPTAIGRGLYGGNKVDFLNGQVDDVQVYDRALNAGEVATLSGVPLTPAQVTVNGADTSRPVSSQLFGTFIEDINHSGEGGLYPELIQNRSLMASTTSPLHWSAVTSGTAAATVALDPGAPLNSALTRSLRLDVSSVPKGTRVGVANDGFWGVPAKPSTSYRASFYAKATAGFTGPLTVAIETPAGKQLAAGTVTGLGTGWKQFSLTLSTPAGIAASGDNRFVISTESVAVAGKSVWLDQVSLFPPTWKNRGNGLRPDIMQWLDGLHASFLRLPGGNYLEGNTVDTRFNWKNSIGPVQSRPGHQNDAWGYWSTDGLGLLEYLQWAEDLGQKPVLALYAGYSLNGTHVPTAQLAPYVQDAVDEIEYATGPVTSTWGAKRAADGHPAPFSIQYVEIGNEDWLDSSGSYDSRYAAFYDALHAAYPSLKFIATTSVSSRPVDVYDEHFYESANWMNTHSSYYDARSRTGSKVFVGEWATREGSPTPNLRAALGDASWMTGLLRNSDVVTMESYAPLLVNVHNVAWDVDLIGFDNLTSYGSPSYYVQQLLGTHHGDVVLPTTTSADAGLNTVTTRDSATGATYVTVVNPSGAARPATVNLTGVSSVASTATATVISGTDPNDTNSITDPVHIVPVTSTVTGTGTSFTHTFPPYSVTVLTVTTH